MCRMIGLPARYVEGYLATPDENGTAYVTGLQAHAWTEVYFSGFGWLTFGIAGFGLGLAGHFLLNRQASTAPTMQGERD